MKINNFFPAEPVEQPVSVLALEEASDGLSDAYEGLYSLAYVKTVATESSDAPDTLSKLLGITVESIARGLKVEVPQPRVALEDNSASRLSIATETIGDMIKAIWNGIKATLKWLWKKIKAFFGFVDKKDKKARLKKIEQKAKAIAAAARNGTVIRSTENFDRLNSLAVNVGSHPSHQQHTPEHSSQEYSDGSETPNIAETEATMAAAEVEEEPTSPTHPGDGATYGTVLEPFRFLNKELDLTAIRTFAEELKWQTEAFVGFVEAVRLFTDQVFKGIKNYIRYGDQLFALDANGNIRLKNPENFRGGSFRILKRGSIRDIDETELAAKYRLSIRDIKEDQVYVISNLAYGAQIIFFETKTTRESCFLVNSYTTKPTDQIRIRLIPPEELPIIASTVTEAVTVHEESMKKVKQMLGSLDKVQVDITAFIDDVIQGIGYNGRENVALDSIHDNQAGEAHADVQFASETLMVNGAPWQRDPREIFKNKVRQYFIGQQKMINTKITAIGITSAELERTCNALLKLTEALNECYSVSVESGAVLGEN